MLCFEGIQLMLNIFLGRKPIPNYRLVEPPSGREKIFVKEDVSTGSYCSAMSCNANALEDYENSAICLRGNPAQREIRSGTIRVLHRVARQAPSEPRKATDTRRYWYTRSGHRSRTLHLRCVISKGLPLCSLEPNKGIERRGIDVLL